MVKGSIFGVLCVSVENVQPQLSALTETYCIDELLDRCIDFSQTCADDETSDDEGSDAEPSRSVTPKLQPSFRNLAEIKTDSETETETEDEEMENHSQPNIICFDQSPIVRQLGDPHL